MLSGGLCPIAPTCICTSSMASSSLDRWLSDSSSSQCTLCEGTAPVRAAAHPHPPASPPAPLLHPTCISPASLLHPPCISLLQPSCIFPASSLHPPAFPLHLSLHPSYIPPAPLPHSAPLPTARGRTHVLRTRSTSALLCRALPVVMARNRCRSMAQRRTGPSAGAEQSERGTGESGAGRREREGRSALTSHGGGAPAVIQDGQLAENVPGPQSAELPAPLGHAQTSLCGVRAASCTAADAHTHAHTHTRARGCGAAGERAAASHVGAHTATRPALSALPHLPRCTWRSPRRPRPPPCRRPRVARSRSSSPEPRGSPLPNAAGSRCAARPPLSGPGPCGRGDGGGAAPTLGSPPQPPLPPPGTSASWFRGAAGARRRRPGGARARWRGRGGAGRRGAARRPGGPRRRPVPAPRVAGRRAPPPASGHAATAPSRIPAGVGRRRCGVNRRHREGAGRPRGTGNGSSGHGATWHRRCLHSSAARGGL